MRLSVAVIGVALLGIGVPLLAAGVELPEGWRFATESELASDPSRNNSPTRYLRAVAVLNGDGVDDEAFILKSTRFSGEALWVRLSKGKDDYSWIKLDEMDFGSKYPHVDPVMGVDIVKPGVVSYACFDEAKECNFVADSERPKLKLRDPALMYFKIDSSASMYFWSNKYSRFLKVWLSD